MRGRWRFGFRPLKRLPFWLSYGLSAEESRAFGWGFAAGLRDVAGCLFMLALVAGAGCACLALLGGLQR